jgi:TolB-like protein/class 3 adenylate cyclase/tetratricopeptide (TPR) repeat protein
MDSERLPRKLAAILYADVAGYSRLTGEDEDATHRRLSAYLDLIAAAVGQYRGRVVHYAGDAVLAMFDAAADALTCAAAVQRDLESHNRDLHDARRIEFRIGVNLGDVIEDRGDIYGDGVNVAARLESLAKPGGICISESVRLAVGARLPLEYDFLGEQQVKNISEPVRAYHARLNDGAELPTAESPKGSSTVARGPRRMVAVLLGLALAVVIIGGLVYWQSWQSGMGVQLDGQPSPALPDKPSIVVLPFANMSGEPEQEYFADGMTDDLITDLSKISGLFVISRNSAFTYKGRHVEVKSIGKALGVRYVLEGSVRRVGDRVRINAQLIDAVSGGHLWADRYDGSMVDVFALQDRVIQKIIAGLSLNLTTVEQQDRRRGGTTNAQAHDAFLQGWEHYQRFTADDFVKAIPRFQAAIELDPDYGRAYAALASLYWITFRHGDVWSLKVNPDSNNWVATTLVRESVDKYTRLAMRNPSPLAHKVKAAISWDYRQFDESLAEAERAVALDPNDPDGYVALAWALIFNGRAEEAVAAVERAMRLDPLHPGAYMYVLGMARLVLREYRESANVLRRAHERSPEFREINLPLVVAYGNLGQEENARIALQRYSEAWTSFERSKVDGVMAWVPFRRESDIRHFGDALVEAGLCCEDLLEQYIENLRLGGTLQ